MEGPGPHRDRHTPGARPQAEQAAYRSIGGRYIYSPAAWAEYMALTGWPAEPLAVAHLLFHKPEAALAGTCRPAGTCRAPPPAPRTAGVRRRLLRGRAAQGHMLRPGSGVSPRAGC